MEMEPGMVDVHMVEEAEAEAEAEEEAVVSEGVEEGMGVGICNKNQVDTMTMVNQTLCLHKGVVSFFLSIS